jgi:hypothetical protein
MAVVSSLFNVVVLEKSPFDFTQPNEKLILIQSPHHINNTTGQCIGEIIKQMSDDAVPNQLLSPHLCLAIPLFGPQQAKTLALCRQLSSITDAVWRHVTEYDAAESFHVLHMGPMSDDAVPNQLLSPHLCLAMPLFGAQQA